MEEWLEALLSPRAWPFPASSVEHLETHISHLFLVGAYAYKVKKAVDLGFLDFSTLEKRRFYCEEELRLNSRMAPGIYLEVVPIARDEEGLHVEGKGEVVEYAVKMRRFDGACLFDRMPLAARHVDALARRVASFHKGLSSASADTEWGAPEKVWHYVDQNFGQILELGLFPQWSGRLRSLWERARQRFEALRPRLLARKEKGWIRECHGDMHLGNIVLVDGEVMVFDGIEFNAELRWIDTVNDIAFLLMDLERRGMERLAWRFLNLYLEEIGDYEGVPLLEFYKAYRAMVRAKVAAIRLSQDAGGSEERGRQFAGYIGYAERCLQRNHRPLLCITHGLSGSGKSHFCREMRERLGLIHLRSDLERKRLFGLSPQADSRSAVEGGIYTPEATERTYGRLEELAGLLLEAGYDVVVDATFLEAARRRRFRELAARKGAAFRLLVFEAPEAVLRQRVVERSREGRDVSEADLAVLERQMEKRQPLSAAERREAVVVETTKEVDWKGVQRALA